MQSRWKGGRAVSARPVIGKGKARFNSRTTTPLTWHAAIACPYLVEGADV